MSYISSNLYLLSTSPSGVNQWQYSTTDAIGTVTGASYFADGAQRGDEAWRFPGGCHIHNLRSNGRSVFRVLLLQSLRCCLNKRDCGNRVDSSDHRRASRPYFINTRWRQISGGRYE